MNQREKLFKEIIIRANDLKTLAQYERRINSEHLKIASKHKLAIDQVKVNRNKLNKLIDDMTRYYPEWKKESLLR